jgi:hypothetical protein
MTPAQRHARQAAADIHQTLVNYNHDRAPVLPETYWNACQRLLRMREKARHRGWLLALNRVERRMLQVATDCSNQLLTMRDNLIQTIREQRLLNEETIADDLLALSAEFDEVRIDSTSKSIAVETPSIVLQNIELGPFRVVLEWTKLRYYRSYRVIALEPNTAASKSGVTHPHVRDEELCEGDGHQAIRQALLQGRILDFFLLVRQILENYSPNNAHVKLDDWEGRECSHCGDLIHSEGDVFCCAHCGDDLCGGCAVCCDECGEYFCSNHTSTCRSCNESFCRNCLAVCRQCQEKFCKECLDEEQCPNCRPEAEDSDDASDDEQPYDPDGAETEELETAEYADAAI